MTTCLPNDRATVIYNMNTNHLVDKPVSSWGLPPFTFPTSTEAGGSLPLGIRGLGVIFSAPSSVLAKASGNGTDA